LVIRSRASVRAFPRNSLSSQLPDNDLAQTGDEYIEFLREQGRSVSFVRSTQLCLLRGLEYFDVVQAEEAATARERQRCKGPRNLVTISSTDVLAFSRWLQTQGKPRRGRTTMAPSTIREHLFALRSWRRTAKPAHDLLDLHR
jgi:predicted glutamine amidotransferase